MTENTDLQELIAQGINNENSFYCQLGGNLDKLQFDGMVTIPEDATIKDIKQFQEEVERTVNELHDAAFGTK